MRNTIFVAFLFVACSSGGGGGDDDGGIDAGSDVHPDVIIDPANCVPSNATNDGAGVGGYCSPGGGQCAGSGPGGAPRICSADLSGAEPHAWFCTYPCTTSTDCGSAAVCVATPQGSICVPPSCTSLTDAGGDAETDASDASSDVSSDAPNDATTD